MNRTLMRVPLLPMGLWMKRPERFSFFLFLIVKVMRNLSDEPYHQTSCTFVALIIIVVVQQIKKKKERKERKKGKFVA